MTYYLPDSCLQCQSVEHWLSSAVEVESPLLQLMYATVLPESSSLLQLMYATVLPESSSLIHYFLTLYCVTDYSHDSDRYLSFFTFIFITSRMLFFLESLFNYLRTMIYDWFYNYLRIYLFWTGKHFLPGPVLNPDSQNCTLLC